MRFQFYVNHKHHSDSSLINCYRTQIHVALNTPNNFVTVWDSDSNMWYQCKPEFIGCLYVTNLIPIYVLKPIKETTA